MEARDQELEQRLAQHVGDGAPIYAFRELGSTIDMASSLATQGATEGTLVFARRQSKGRGRLGRTWSSPEGGLYCSLILRPRRSSSEISQLSLVAGLAVVEAIQKLTGLAPSIRWPNDVLLKSQKVCGVLVEAKGEAVIVGIGVNVTTDPRLLPVTATSLAAAGRACDAHRLAGALYGHFRGWYDEWTARGFAPIRQALRPWITLFGQVVHVTAGSEELEGTATDLDESGRLLVRLDSGIVRAFDAGEITLLR